MGRPIFSSLLLLVLPIGWIYYEAKGQGSETAEKSFGDNDLEKSE